MKLFNKRSTEASVEITLTQEQANEVHLALHTVLAMIAGYETDIDEWTKGSKKDRHERRKTVAAVLIQLTNAMSFQSNEVRDLYLNEIAELRDTLDILDIV